MTRRLYSSCNVYHQRASATHSLVLADYSPLHRTCIKTAASISYSPSPPHPRSPLSPIPASRMRLLTFTAVLALEEPSACPTNSSCKKKIAVGGVETRGSLKLIRVRIQYTVHLAVHEGMASRDPSTVPLLIHNSNF